MALKDQPEKYIVREGSNRLGGIELVHVAVDESGARLEWTDGFKTHIPSDWYQLSWRV